MRLFEYEVGKTPDEIELQAKQSPDSITANIAIVNQGTPLNRPCNSFLKWYIICLKGRWKRWR